MRGRSYNLRGVSDYRESHLGVDQASWYETGLYGGDTYDSWNWSLEQGYLDDLLARRLPGEVRHLDFACGTGRIVGYLEDKVASSTGLDISPDMLALARPKLKRATLVCGDITRDADLVQGPFDLITAFRFFLNAQDQLRHEVLDRLAPLLAPEGLLVFSIHGNATSVRALSYAWRRFVRREHINTLSIRGVERRLAAHGLRVVERRGMCLVTRRLFARIGPRRAERLERLLTRFPVLQRVAVDLVFVATRDAAAG